MGAKTFKKQDIRAAVWQETLDSPLVFVERGPCLDEGKYQFQEHILQDISTGRYYSYGLSKSGSYFSDFTYSFEWEKDEIELVEVIKKTKVIEVWIAVE